MSNLICYTGGGLDRVSNMRKDPNWVSQQLVKNNSQIIPIWRDLNLVANYSNTKNRVSYSNFDPQAVIFNPELLSKLVQKTNEIVLLGLHKKCPVFAADFSNNEKNLISMAIGQGEFIDLRQIGSQLRPTESALMAYARGIMHWHRKNQFCSRCGNITVSKEGGFMRLCSSALCLHTTFPRTDPAVIMLVENTNPNNNVRNCLLGRQNIWPKGMYSTLAGFVEPGESLEEAVSREVFEESGIYTEKIDYRCSQPWPFPSSIMLGFCAQAKTTKINFDKQELEDVKWFSEEEVRAFGEWGDKSTVCQLPRKDSIARYLIETWLNRSTEL